MSVADTAPSESSPSAGVVASADSRRLFGLPFAFASFLIVGASAFLVTEAVLFLTYGKEGWWAGLLSFFPEETNVLGVKPNIHLLVASAVSVEVAIIWKFILYERWTFADRPRRGNIFYRFLQLNGASFLGTVVTLSIVNILTPVLGISPYLTTAIGVLAAFMINWLFSNHFIWRSHEPTSA